MLELLDKIGHIPLPPYIDRADSAEDKSRYQTVYAENPGAVAAPTAGLHFDNQLLDDIKAMGAELAFVTLHVVQVLFSQSGWIILVSIKCILSG